MFQKALTDTKLLPSLASIKRERNVKYLMELTTENLLFSYYAEAGLNGRLNYKPINTHGGWDSPTCHIRGTFTGHWLSAAAHIYSETGDMQLKAKADFIVKEIGRCQQENGNGWAFSIPEKYLYSLKKGKQFWAPQYVCHKTMMGLLDMYLLANNKQALDIVIDAAEWFYNFTNDITRENMDHMMDIEETGGIMELWADLYAVTSNPKHLELVRRYERPLLIEPLYSGKDVLTNMHANATIPEIHGCARAYEVTGEERYRKIVETYWKYAVTERGQYATGGQTSGEIWTAKNKQSARLSEMNQEHCTVYNMIRLADYLFRWTGNTVYSDYIEQNIYNGLFAQGYWQARAQDTLCEPIQPDSGLVSYFLPLAAGSQKKWGSKTEDFWCCHCTLVQANARYREFIYYKTVNELIVSQYLPSELTATINGSMVNIRQTEADLCGQCIEIKDIALNLSEKPGYKMMQFEISTQEPATFKIKFRLPWWLKSDMQCNINHVVCNYKIEDGYAVVEREWLNDTIEILLPKGITCWPLADKKDTVAFLDGPVLLAGLVEEERTLYGDISDPGTLIAPHDERHWVEWLNTYKTVNQPVNFYLKPIYDIGKEKYTVYFPVKKE